MIIRSRRTPPPLAGVIFDLGGTLIYPTSTPQGSAAHLDAWLGARGHGSDLGTAIAEARHWMWTMTRATGRQHTTEEAIRRAFVRLGRPAPPQTLVEQIEHAFFEPELAGYRLFPGVVELLRRLRAARMRTACVSNASSHWLIEQIVDRLGFRGYLDPVVSSAGFGLVKPDPGIFRSVLQRWEVPPERAAMVGDTLETDIAGAQAMGMRTIYVTMAPNPDNVSHRHIVADADAGSLREVERILFVWARPRS